jgi:actin-related protein 8
MKQPVPAPTYVEGIARPRKGRNSGQSSSQQEDEYQVTLTSDDPVSLWLTFHSKENHVFLLQFEEKVAQITTSLRDRMRFYKLRVTPNAAGIASTFNDAFKPEIIAEHNDPYRVDWIWDSADDVLIGEQVCFA